MLVVVPVVPIWNTVVPDGGPTAPPLQGSVPVQRLRSEIQANPVPPACVQNAMMTKDKKPFTYTPGGIDLSEIRSPRMAKRIERNAQAQGVGEVPRSPNTYQQHGPLPPSAMAAMQTNMPVQVFPSGAPPPPPPPPPSTQQQGRGIPPPPPPPPPQPTGPLPTKPVSTNEGVFDRPDMTRIIPENPMALLRKTPKVERKTFLDELNDMDQQGCRPTGVGRQMSNHPQQYQPTAQQYQQSPSAHQQYQSSPPIQQQYQTNAPTQSYHQPTPPIQQQYQPSPPIRQNNVASPQYTPQQPSYQRPSPPVTPSSNNNINQRPSINSQVGTLYIPPVTSPSNGNAPYDVQSPPTPPQRSPQSPQSPQVQLNKAPRPWQQQQQKAREEKPAWAQRGPEEGGNGNGAQGPWIEPPYKAPGQVQVQPEPPRRQQQQQAQGNYYQPQLVSYPSQASPQPGGILLKDPPAPRAGVEVVWVTQPEVLVHPGNVPYQQQQQQQRNSPQVQQQQQQQQPRWNPNQPKQPQQQVDVQGARVIPIQMEGAQPQTPERNFNRQQSWGNPSQSNSFKVLQKMTSTDGEIDDDNEPSVEHAPRASQEFNQTPADQIRKLKLSHDDRDLVHKFKQDEDNYLRQEVDPRYRGAAIPSKAFRLLQSMTDSCFDIPDAFPSTSVPRGQQQSTPHVRNIPIQLEGDDPSGAYVHPSQQTVQEPKKYTGGNIPGRSFKMLQSMTGQTSPLANNEHYEPTPYSPSYNMYPPPPYPPPQYYDYWNYYYQTQPQEVEASDAEKNAGTTNYPNQEGTASRSTTPSVCSSCRNTPVPFWNYYYPMPYYQNQETDEESENPELAQYHQQMWDPYYYPHPYYYYYPPPQTPQLSKSLKRRSYTDYEEWCSTNDANQVPKSLKRRSYAESEDCSSSNDEIAYYTQQAKGVQQEILAARVVQASKTPGLTSPSAETDCEDIQEDKALEAEDEDSSDSDEEIPKGKDVRSGSLQSVKSVKDMKMLNDDEDKLSDVETLVEDEIDSQEVIEEDYDVEDASTEDASITEVEDTIPHALSVIFEDSEASYRTSRCSSIMTDASDETVVVEEQDDVSDVVSVKLPLKLTFTVNGDNEDVTEITVGTHEIEPVTYNEDNDTEAGLIVSVDNDEVVSERKSSTDSEVDFWSEIITEEEVVPKPNRLETYKNAIQDLEVVTNKTIQTTDEESNVTINTFCKSAYHNSDIKEIDNKLEAIEVTNLEMGVSSFEFKKRNSIGDIKDNKKMKVDKANTNCDSLKKSSSVEATEDTLIVVNVEDYKLSNLVFERKEEKEILAPPKLELDFIVEDFCTKQNMVKECIDQDKIVLDNKNINSIEEDTSDDSESSSDFDNELIKKLCANSQEFNNIKYQSDIEEAVSIDCNDNKLISNVSTDEETRIKGIKVESDNTDSEEEVKTNDTLDTVREFDVATEEMTRRATLTQVEELQVDKPEAICSANSSNSSSLSRSSSISEKGREHKEFSEGDESEDESEEDHDTPVIEIDKNNNEDTSEVVLEVPSIKERIKSLQEASCKPIKKIIATIELPKSPKQLPSIIQLVQTPLTKSIDNSEDEGDSGVTSDMSRHISDSESEFSELRKLTRYQRAATHSRLYQLLHSSYSEEELEDQEESATDVSMMKRREHLTLPLKKSVESESSSGLNSPTSPLTDKLASELVLSLLRKKKGQIFRNMPMERLHAAALKILQEDKDCTDLSSSEEFHNCLSPLRGDTECSTPAQTPAEFYCNSAYSPDQSDL